MKRWRLWSMIGTVVVLLFAVTCRSAQVKKPDSALIKAVEAGDSGRAKKLLEKGGDPNMKDKSGRPLITLVVKAPIVSTIHGESRNGPHTIVKHWNQAAMVRLLVQYGAKVNVKDRDGWTPLLQAEASEESDLVTFLKNSGARE